MGDELLCPNCGTTKYRNPNLKLFINVCGHSLCEKCVDILFIRGSGSCYKCKMSLRRANFRAQQFDDAKVDKEVEIRKKVTKELNLFEEDFETVREYNDFLEQVEDIIFSIASDSDAQQAKAKMEEIKLSKADAIKRNRHRLSRDQEEIRRKIQLETEAIKELKMKLAMEEMIIQKAKQENKSNLLKELETSNLPADLIVNKHHKDVNVLLDSDLYSRRNIDLEAVAKTEPEEVCYIYSEPGAEIVGPNIPSLYAEDSVVSSAGYLDFVCSPGDVEKAGGYHKVLACQRALSDAFNCLYF